MLCTGANGTVRPSVSMATPNVNEPDRSVISHFLSFYLMDFDDFFKPYLNFEGSSNLHGRTCVHHVQGAQGWDSARGCALGPPGGDKRNNLMTISQASHAKGGTYDRSSNPKFTPFTDIY